MLVCDKCNTKVEEVFELTLREGCYEVNTYDLCAECFLKIFSSDQLKTLSYAAIEILGRGVLS